MLTTDTKAIKALAHPLRLDLLELLATTGPATAAHCGRVLGVPQANCSFHLRQLAKYGFVADAGPGSDRRERKWRVADPPPAVRIGTDGDAVVRQQLARVVVDREARAALDYLARQDDDAPEWRTTAGMITAVAAMSPEDAAEVKEKWRTLLEPYLARTAAAGFRLRPGQRFVRYFMAATPTLELTQGDHRDDAHDDSAEPADPAADARERRTRTRRRPRRPGELTWRPTADRSTS